MPPEILELFKSGGAWAVALGCIYTIFHIVTKTAPEAMGQQQQTYVTSIEQITNAFVAATDRAATASAEIHAHLLALQQTMTQVMGNQLMSNSAKVDMLVKVISDLAPEIARRRASDKSDTGTSGT